MEAKAQIKNSIHKQKFDQFLANKSSRLEIKTEQVKIKEIVQKNRSDSLIEAQINFSQIYAKK